MNVSKAFEMAFCKMVRASGVGAKTVLRPWQSLAFDGSWKASIDEQYPMIDIRFAPEEIDESQATCTSTGDVVIQTLTEDDKDHSVISKMYDSVHGVAVGIFRDFINGQADTFAEFKSLVEEYYSNQIAIGGITLANATPPEAEDSKNTIGFSMVIHFSYKKRQ